MGPCLAAGAYLPTPVLPKQPTGCGLRLLRLQTLPLPKQPPAILSAPQKYPAVSGMLQGRCPSLHQHGWMSWTESTGVLGQAVVTISGTPTPHRAENWPWLRVLVMSSRVTLLVAMSHPGIFTPSRAVAGSAFTWDISLLSSEACVCLAPQAPAGLGPGDHGTIQGQGKVTRCSIALQGCLAGK